jgi:hypothetical protein
VPRAGAAAINFTHTAVVLETTSFLNWLFVTSARFKSDGFHRYMQQTLHQTTATLTLAGNKHVLLYKRSLSLKHFSGEKGKLPCAAKYSTQYLMTSSN